MKMEPKDIENQIAFEDWREQQKDIRLSKEDRVSKMEEEKITNKLVRKVKHQALIQSGNKALMARI